MTDEVDVGESRGSANEQITFALGSFWAAEWEFHYVEGVIDRCVGLAFSDEPALSVEAVEVTFDSSIVAVDKLLLQWFMAHHHGARRPLDGRMLPGAVFAHSVGQYEVATAWLAKFQEREWFRDRKFTSVIARRTRFERAPDTEQRVFERHGVDRWFILSTAKRARSGRTVLVRPEPTPGFESARAALVTVAARSGGCIDAGSDPVAVTPRPPESSRTKQPKGSPRWDRGDGVQSRSSAIR